MLIVVLFNLQGKYIVKLFPIIIIYIQDIYNGSRYHIILRRRVGFSLGRFGKRIRMEVKFGMDFGKCIIGFKKDLKISVVGEVGIRSTHYSSVVLD